MRPANHGLNRSRGKTQPWVKPYSQAFSNAAKMGPLGNEDILHRDMQKGITHLPSTRAGRACAYARVFACLSPQKCILPRRNRAPIDPCCPSLKFEGKTIKTARV